MKWLAGAMFFLLCGLPTAKAEWTEPVQMSPQPGVLVREPWISNDGLRLYAAIGGNLQVIERDSVAGPWHQWHSVSSNINNGWWQKSPCESPEGDTLYFASYLRPEGCYGRYDIYYSVRTDTGWGPVVNCGPNINSTEDEWSVGLSRDGCVLMVSANRSDSTGGRDLFFSRKQSDGTWGQLVHWGPEINTFADDEHPCMSRDNHTLIWSSFGGVDNDLLFSHKVDSVWQPRAAFPSPVNSPTEIESDPCLSFEGNVIWFVRQNANGDYALYCAVDTLATTAHEPHGAVSLGTKQLSAHLGIDGKLSLSIQGLSRAGEWRVAIFNILGREVLREPVNFGVSANGTCGGLSLGGIPNGCYFVSVEVPGERLNTKLIWTR